jgi:hypothetical protein
MIKPVEHQGRASNGTPFTILLLCLTGLMPLAVGLFALRITIGEPRQRAAEAEAWIAVPCTIRELSIATQTIPRARQTGGSSVGYAPQVKFDYVWQEVTITGERFWLGTTFWRTRADVEQVLAPYEVDTEATCFVNPQQPTQAVLTRDLFERMPLGWDVLGGLSLLGTVVIATVVWLNEPGRQVREIDALADPLDPPPALSTLLWRWCLALGWNGVVGLVGNSAWLGGAPVSFFVGFLSVFGLIGLVITAGAIATLLDYSLGRGRVRIPKVTARPTIP